MRRAGLLLAVAMVLTACSRVDTAAQVWLGTTEASATGVTHTLRLEVHERGERLTGHYLVEAARGEFDGLVGAGGALAATLTAGPGCTFELEGVFVGDSLTATFAPLECPGGEAGTWSLVRQ